MQRKQIYVILLVVMMTSHHTALAVILRPNWFPYFRDEFISLFRGSRTLPDNVSCPPDMTDYECYHTFMAVWTRLLQKDKRIFSGAPRN